MVKTKKTYIDVINDTVAFYSKDPENRRSIKNEVCLYNGPNGKQCAFARCAQPICKALEAHDADNLLEIKGFSILKPEYRHLLNKSFWQDLQVFHDDSFYWDSNGLSKHGKEHLERLKQIYK